jgi:predicted permease
MSVVGRLAYLLALLGVGVAVQYLDALTESWDDRLNAIAFYGALPAVVFTATYDQSLAGLVSPALVGGLLAVVYGTVALAWVVHRGRDSTARRSVAVVQSYHGNLGYLGVPIVVATFGDRAGAAASVILGVLIVVQVPTTVLVLVRVNGTDTSLARELRSVLTNPVLGGLVAGVLVSVGVFDPLAGVDAARTVADAALVYALDPLSAVALPLALLLVGASLDLDLPAVDVGATGSVVATKVVAMPALAAGVFTLLGVSGPAFVAGVVLMAMPTAISTYVYASELGGDPEFASLNVFTTTLSAVGTLFVLLQSVQ